MELITYDNKMPDLYNQIIESNRKLAPINKIDEKDLKLAIQQAIQLAYKIKQIGVPQPESLKDALRLIYAQLLEKYKYINTFDIIKASELGAYGELKEDGDLNNISPEIFINWIKRYVKRIRSEAIDKHNKEVEKAQKEADEAYHKNGNLRLINNICKYYDSLGSDTIPIKVIAGYFRHLRDLGLVKLTPAEYRDIELKGYAKYKIMEQNDTIYGKYALTTPQDLMQEIALNETFKQWHKEGKKLIVENETLKLV